MSKTPDAPQTALALRVWRTSPHSTALFSLNAPATGRQSWMAKAMQGPEGHWSFTEPLRATCALGRGHPESDVPDPGCSCGIYATNDLSVIASYLSSSAPVLGIVELGGRVIPATQGYRAKVARIAAILNIEAGLTLPVGTLKGIAAAYRVPLLVPHSTNPEDYRDLIGPGATIADEADEFLRGLGDEDES